MNIKIGLGTTLNIGNFSNIKVDVSMEKNITDGPFTDDRERLELEELYTEVENQLIDKIERLLSRFDQEGLLDD